jgi:2OG-Fe(II) oxygenase superfamily
VTLQIAKAATVDRPGDTECRALREQFGAHHWVRLPGVLAPSLLADVQARVARAEFTERVHPGVDPPSIDLCMAPNAASAMLELAFNDPAVLRAVEAIAGCGRIARFGGFIYRLSPRSGHHHNWHDDLVETRLVAMSVNLGPGTYEGGLLEFRDRASEAILDRVANTGPGDALLFRIDAALQHRATPVTAGLKTAFAGWYFGDQTYAARLRELAHLRASRFGGQALRPATRPPQPASHTPRPATRDPHTA